MSRNEVDLYTALELDARSRHRVLLRVTPGRRFDFRPLFALAGAFVVIVTVLGLRELEARPAGSPSPAPAAMQRVALYPGVTGQRPDVAAQPWLTLPVPAGWYVAQKAEASPGRAGGGRAALISNVPIDDYATEKPYPEHLAWAQLPREAVVVEVRDVCGGASCMGAVEESSFPLRWSDAQLLKIGGLNPPSVPATFDARQLLLRYFLEGHVLVTYVGDRASAHDRALVENVVSGIAPSPLPAAGVVHGNWLALGAFASLPADQPVFGTLPGQASLSPASYYVIRHGPGLLAHPMLFQTALAQWCTLLWDGASRTFSCDGRSERWDRYGRAITSNTSDLDQFSTLVKDGKAYLFFNSLNGGRITLPGE
jgi:hypothetical protein